MVKYIFNILCIVQIILIFFSNIEAQTTSPLTFTEVMFNPVLTNGEYVEIYNTSSTETIDLTGYKFKYYTSSNNNLVHVIGGTLLKPNSFAVIIQGNLDFENSVYKTIIPLGAVILKTSSNNFGSSGMANTTSREINLVDPSGNIIDTYIYSADNSAGYSDEKIIISKDNSSTNWGNTLKLHGTPGFKNSLSPVDYDLSISFSNNTFINHVQGDTLKLCVKINNKGKLIANNYEVNLYYDINKDYLGSVNELILSEKLSNLASGDSTIIEHNFHLETESSYNFLTEVIFVDDEKFENNKSILIIYASERPASYNDIVINEIMYAPTGDEPEWVELFNKSERKLNLKNWKIGDNSTSIIISNSDFYLDPKEYLVISKDLSINNFHNISSKLLVRSLPTLNNGGDDVVERNNFNKVVDSIKYLPNWGGSLSGRSLERIAVDSSSVDKNNWGSSTAKNRSTPGKINSIAVKNNDILLKSFKSSTGYAEVGKELKMIIEVENIGIQKAVNFSVNLYYDINNDSIPDDLELINKETISELEPGANSIIYLSTTNFNEGINNFIAVVVFDFDEFIDNDVSLLKVVGVRINEIKGDIIINEIMYAPFSPEPEWIEIFNRSNKQIELKGYQIADVSNKVIINHSPFVLLPEEYLVIARDSTIYGIYNNLYNCIVSNLPSLNNSWDIVILLDSLNRVIDSLEYRSSWGGSGGKSLERILPDVSSFEYQNWQTSTGKYRATPGRINSVTPKKYDLELISVKNQSNFAEVGKSLNLISIIKNKGKSEVNNFTILLYLDKNGDDEYQKEELIFQTYEMSLKTGDSIEVELKTNNISKGINKFFVVINYEEDQFLDNNIIEMDINGVIINEVRNDLVINEIMYAPISPEPEWIEIFNKSNKVINLKGYQIADETSKTIIFKDSLFIKSNEYFVIARDSSLFSIYSGLDKNVIIGNFPSLNNTGDRIVLMDSLTRVIDSLNYKSSWGGMLGKSLERYDVTFSSTDSTNWKTTTLLSGGTPGKINSISKKKYDGSITKVMYTPEFPLVGETVEIQSEAYNKGKENISGVFILFEVKDQNNFKEIEKSSPYIILPEESIVHKFIYRTEPIYSKHTYEVHLLVQNDEDITNNKILSFLSPGYPEGSVLINEIMYNPTNGEPEWIELYNTSDYVINLENWSVTDILTNPVKTKLKEKHFPKNSYLVISKDTSIINYHKSIPGELTINNFANLNNDADGVVIKDSRDVTIDSLRYERAWGGENGKSLERKTLTEPTHLKSNWSSSKDIELSTPGRINSITKKNYDLAVTEIYMIPNFPVSNEEVNFAVKLLNYGIFSSENFVIEFYLINDLDTLLFDRFNCSNLQPNDSLVITSLAKTKITEKLILQCVVLFNQDEELSNNIFVKEFNTGYKKGSIIITEIMFNPYDGESEWVEIFNNTIENINLNGWQISDVVNPSKAKICNKDVFIKPGEYAILTPDTNKFPYYPPVKFFQTKFGTLGNTSDGIIIYDLRGLTIDSMVYNSKWGAEKGYSIERINFDLPSNDSTNWTNSLSIYGATPGMANSVTGIPSYTPFSIVINEIMYEPSSYNCEFIEFYNTTMDSIQIGGWSLNIGNSRKLKLSSTYKIFAPKSFIILTKDSSVMSNYSDIRFSNSNVIINNSLSLSNNGTSLILNDLYGNTIDTVFYKPVWHNKNIIDKKNKSLERINPLINSNDNLNWSTSVCKEGATPCYENSIFTDLKHEISKITITPNPFSPDSDGFEDFTTINLSLSSVYSQVKIRVFDSKGRLMRTLVHYSPMASSNSIIYDGLDDNGIPLRIGIYILLIEAVNESGDVETFKLPLVSARKL